MNRVHLATLVLAGLLASHDALADGTSFGHPTGSGGGIAPHPVGGAAALTPRDCRPATPAPRGEQRPTQGKDLRQTVCRPVLDLPQTR